MPSKVNKEVYPVKADDYRKSIHYLEFLLAIIPLLFIVLIYMMAAQNGVGFFELVQTQVTYNIILLAAVFHAASFLLIYQVSANMSKQTGYCYNVCILLLLCVLQFVLMDIPVAVLLLLLIRKLNRKSEISLKEAFSQLFHSEYKLPFIFMAVLLAFVVIVIFALLIMSL